MKPAKIQKGQDSKKKELIGNLSTPRIQNYFKSVPKQSKVETNKKTNESESKAVYIGLLKKKMQDFAGAEEIEHDVHAADAVLTENEFSEFHEVDGTGEPVENCQRSSQVTGCVDCKWENKYKELKKLYIKLSLHCSEVELNYSDLLKTKTRFNQLDIDDTVSSSDEFFSPREIRFLRSMSFDKESDSTFVLQCLKYAYKNDLSILTGKTMNGTSEVMKISDDGEVKYIPGKDPLTPNKVARIRELFIERISNCQIDAVSYGERIKDAYMNKFIAKGILNIAKKQLTLTQM